MNEGSHLAEMYEDVFGVPPSASSLVALRRMQATLGLQRGDAFSRMLIVQLRSADQIEETRLKLEDVVKSIAPMLVSSRDLVRELNYRSDGIARVNRSLPTRRRVAQEIDTYRKASPLASYLLEAFRWRTRYVDLDARERIGAARGDMMLFVAVLALAMIVGAFLGRVVG